ncbi:MAG TPA: hypothetical protein VK564_06570 [Thermodesulfobacteriota bacterium]|nr:hypothetical protein [Thermodesulfobacteriota bacterium]
MTIKEIFKLIVAYLLAISLGTALFVLSFRSPLFISMDVLFYRGIFLLIATCAIFLLILLIVRYFLLTKILIFRDILLIITIIFSFNLLFFTHFPVTAERSISLFILGYMNNHADRTITKDEITQQYIKKYIIEYGEIEKRFNEQIVTGDIIADGKGYRITKRGQSILNFFNLVDDLFLIDKKIIFPSQ